MSMSMVHRPLGQLLVQERLIDESTLGDLLREQRQTQRPLGRLVVENGHCTEKDVWRCLAKQHDLSWVDLGDASPQPEAISLLTPEVAKELGVLPLSVRWEGSARRLLVAVREPQDVRAVPALAEQTGCRVEAALCDPAQLRLALDRYMDARTVLGNHSTDEDLLRPIGDVDEVDTGIRRAVDQDLRAAGVPEDSLVAAQPVLDPEDVEALLLEPGDFDELLEAEPEAVAAAMEVLEADEVGAHEEPAAEGEPVILLEHGRNAPRAPSPGVDDVFPDPVELPALPADDEVISLRNQVAGLRARLEELTLQVAEVEPLRRRVRELEAELAAARGNSWGRVEAVEVEPRADRAVREDPTPVMRAGRVIQEDPTPVLRPSRGARGVSTSGTTAQPEGVSPALQASDPTADRTLDRPAPTTD
ncbi:MAG: hypothetical protein AB2A00_33015, partial [Myxococcota bacterium]